MSATERDEYGVRLAAGYAEQVAGLRDQVRAVDRNVLQYILEGRERGAQINAAIVQLGACAAELGHIKLWGRVLVGVSAALVVCVIALLIKVF